MKQHRTAEIPPLAPAAPWRLRLVQTVVALFAVALPLTVQSGARDEFRQSKDIVLAAEAIVLLALATSLWLLGITRLPRRQLRTPLAILIIAAMGWAVVTGAVAANHRVALEAILRLTALLVVFLATVYAMSDRDASFSWPLLVPALINAVLIMLQAAEIWSPYAMVGNRISVFGLLGNPDDAGGYLLAPALLATALAAVLQGKRRIAYGVAALVLTTAIVATQTISATAAATLALPMVALLRIAPRRRRLAMTIFAAMAAMAVLLPIVHPRLRESLRSFRQGDYLAIGSNRLLPFGAALEMVIENPVAGVGPGCFGLEYFPYELRAATRFSILRESMVRGINYSEVHNDHLEIAAETGLPGYALFLAALLLLALRSRGGIAPTEASEVARVLALPLVAGLALLCMAHFALQVASSASIIVQTAAVCFAWRRDDEGA
jgi:O-antigen ligase